MPQIIKGNITTRLPVERGQPIHVTIDGQPVEAFAGETVAAVLLVSGLYIFHHTKDAHNPRSLFCGMGVCFNCLLTINGVPNIRACVTPVVDGMVIETGWDSHE